MRELASEAQAAWGLPGCPKAARQWAGIVGEGTRVDRQEGSPDRAGCNHFNNIAIAIGKLKTSLRHLDNMPAQRVAVLEELWLTDVIPELPERWRKANPGGTR